MSMMTARDWAMVCRNYGIGYLLRNLPDMDVERIFDESMDLLWSKQLSFRDHIWVQAVAESIIDWYFDEKYMDARGMDRFYEGPIEADSQQQQAMDVRSDLY